MKAILLGAGQGTRLRPHTLDRPKCMVEAGGRPLLHWQLDTLRSAGIQEVVVVRAFYVKYLLPIWLDVQCLEWADGCAPPRKWSYA